MIDEQQEQRRRIRRLQNWLIVLAVVVVFLGIGAPTAVIVYFNAQADETQLTISCETVRSTIAVLQAETRNGRLLEDIAHSLGLPIPPPPPIVIPEVPPECVDISLSS